MSCRGCATGPRCWPLLLGGSEAEGARGLMAEFVSWPTGSANRFLPPMVFLLCKNGHHLPFLRTVPGDWGHGHKVGCFFYFVPKIAKPELGGSLESHKARGAGEP